MASDDPVMGKATLTAPGRGSKNTEPCNSMLSFQAQWTRSGLVHQIPFRDVTLVFTLGTVLQCVCLIRVSSRVNGTRGVVKCFGLGLEDIRGNHSQCDEFWGRLNRLGTIDGPHLMTTNVRPIECVVRKTLVAQIVVVAFQAFMPPTFEGFCITHIAENADVSCGGVVSLLTYFGGAVGDVFVRPPIFRILPPTFRILR